ncbi:histidine--tRNA ligase [Rhizobiaceae bacterium]|nr:histidine--tRNA ligase [Rhizobiaceae bacterium]
MADKKKKPQRLKARQPRGFQDREAADIRATEAMMGTIREVYERYGFDPVETPFLEYTDALGKFLPDTDRPNEGVFSLTDDDDQWMSLRYDLTAPLARHFAQNINDLQTPYRTFRSGWVFRNEKPGPGRFRQFMQFDADTVGAAGPAADAEMCMMMCDTMEALGVPRGDYVVRVNDRRVLDGTMRAAGMEGEEHAADRLAALRAIDKLDKFGVSGVTLLLGPGRMDESGDFTKGVGLSGEQVDRILGDLEIVPSDEGLFPADETGLYSEGIGGLMQIEEAVAAGGYDDGRIRIDRTCVRGLEYYTGTVFECELTFPVTNEKGETVQFGSVAGGGRYDGLIKRFTGQDIPATGFSIGVSRLATALKNLGKLPDDGVRGPVVVTVMDRDAEALAGYQQLTQMMRDATDETGKHDIRAEMYQGNPKNFGKQLQYADRRGSPVAIIQGADERAAGTVQVKDLIEGKRLSQEIEDNAEWRASRPAQQTVPVDQMVATVREILRAQRADGTG